jgi:hypothetical protein
MNGRRRFSFHISPPRTRPPIKMLCRNIYYRVKHKQISVAEALAWYLVSGISYIRMTNETFTFTILVTITIQLRQMRERASIAERSRVNDKRKRKRVSSSSCL